MKKQLILLADEESNITTNVILVEGEINLKEVKKEVQNIKNKIDSYTIEDIINNLSKKFINNKIKELEFNNVYY